MEPEYVGTQNIHVAAKALVWQAPFWPLCISNTAPCPLQQHNKLSP